MDKSVERECKREKAAIVRTLSKENFYNSVKLQLYMLQIAPLLDIHYWDDGSLWREKIP